MSIEEYFVSIFAEDTAITRGLLAASVAILSKQDGEGGICFGTAAISKSSGVAEEPRSPKGSIRRGSLYVQSRKAHSSAFLILNRIGNSSGISCSNSFRTNFAA